MSNHPANRHPKPKTSEVFDASALLDEMRADGKPFALGGEEFVLPAPTTWPDAAFQAANNDDPLTASKLILGEADYERFAAVGGNALFLQRLVEKLHGTAMGESAGSSSS